MYIKKLSVTVVWLWYCRWCMPRPDCTDWVTLDDDAVGSGHLDQRSRVRTFLDCGPEWLAVHASQWRLYAI